MEENKKIIREQLLTNISKEVKHIDVFHSILKIGEVVINKTHGEQFKILCKVTYKKINEEKIIGVHLLQNYCKEWAWSQGYIFGSGMAISSWGYAELFKIEDINTYGT